MEVLEEAVDVLLQAQVRRSVGIARNTVKADSLCRCIRIVQVYYVLCVGSAEDIAYDLCQRHL